MSPPLKMAAKITLPQLHLHFPQHGKPIFSGSSCCFFKTSTSPPLHSTRPAQAQAQAQHHPSFLINAAKLQLVHRKFLILPSKATTNQSDTVEQGNIEEDSKMLQYCSLDRKEKKSIGDMEQDFLQALQAFYYEGKAIMSNEEFDNLKEELMWEGSSVVMLSPDEQRFLEASVAYVKGKPILSDEEFDNLKLKLKSDRSKIVIEGPRCSLRSRKVYSDLSVDYQKTFFLYVPAAVSALGLFFFVDELTGFEINFFKLPEPFGFIFTWFAALPILLWGSSSITRSIIKDFLILKGPCPTCGTENTSFFGTILSVSSGGSTNSVRCTNCGTSMIYDKTTCLVTLAEGNEA